MAVNCTVAPVIYLPLEHPTLFVGEELTLPAPETLRVNRLQDVKIAIRDESKAGCVNKRTALVAVEAPFHAEKT